MRELMRRHRVFAAMLVTAAVIRVLVMVAYQPAFWYFGDSGSYIEPSGGVFAPQPYTALGYTVVLQVFERLHTLVAVVAVQHVVGLLMGVAVYALLRRRSVPIWLCCVAAAPVLFDSLEITLEHYILTETMCSALLVSAVVWLLWRPIPGIGTAAGVGLLVGFAWVTRPNSLPIVVLLAVYLLVRRVGWRPLASLVAAFLVPYLAIQFWAAGRHSVYAGSWASRALYSRVALFADCDQLRLTPQQRELCPAEPVGHRPDRADWYGWNGPGSAVADVDSDRLRDFALAAIAQQPGDYARLVVKESAAHYVPGWQLGPQHDCLRQRWSLPASAKDTVPIWDFCHPGLAQPNFGSSWADPHAAPEATALTRGLSGYSKAVRLTPLVFSVSTLLVVLAMFVRRNGKADRRDALLLLAISLSLIIVPVMVAMYEARYGLLAMPFSCVAAALAARQLMSARSAPESPATDAQPHEPAAAEART